MGPSTCLKKSYRSNASRRRLEKWREDGKIDARRRKENSNTFSFTPKSQMKQADGRKLLRVSLLHAGASADSVGGAGSRSRRS